MMDVEFGASSFAQSSLEEKPPETGFSLLFDYKEDGIRAARPLRV